MYSDFFEIIFFVVEKDEDYKKKHGTRHINISNIKYWKVNEHKVQKISNIPKKQTVNKVAGSSGCYSDKADPKKPVMALYRGAVQHEQYKENSNKCNNREE